MLKTPSLGLFGCPSSSVSSRSTCSSLRSSACGNVSLNLATFIARAELERWERLDLRFRGIILSRQINLEVDSDDVQELLDSHNQELTMDELIEMHEQEQDIEEH
ncbi:hypothetical protein TNCV_3261581 [Trichonephila clavipes]|nr:hypothetical protein TNCV_3261581 [Trichonephila clavipes]